MQLGGRSVEGRTSRGWRRTRPALGLVMLLFGGLTGCGSRQEATRMTAGPERPAPAAAASSRARVSATATPALAAISPTGTTGVTPRVPLASAEAAVVTPTASPVTTPTVGSRDTTPDPFAWLTPLALTPTAPRDPPSRPRRLTIPKIGLDAPVFPVGQDRAGKLIALKHDVGWYDQSASPGEGTNIVMWAHVLRFKEAPKIPAPFARVNELRNGDLISTTTESGKQFFYVVTAQLRVRPDQVEYVARSPLERVTLISCIGRNIVVDGELTKAERLITIAEPIMP